MGRELEAKSGEKKFPRVYPTYAPSRDQKFRYGTDTLAGSTYTDLCTYILRAYL